MKKYKYNITLDDSLIQPEKILVDSAAAYGASGVFTNRNDTVSAVSEEMRQLMENNKDILEEDLRAGIYSRKDPSDEWEFEDIL